VYKGIQSFSAECSFGILKNYQKIFTSLWKDFSSFDSFFGLIL